MWISSGSGIWLSVFKLKAKLGHVQECTTFLLKLKAELGHVRECKTAWHKLLVAYLGRSKCFLLANAVS